jgi:hypothetical protein
MLSDFTACAERNLSLWRKARARHILAMTDEELNKSLSNHPNTRKALQRLNADIAKLPPVVDKGDFAKQLEEGMEEGDRWDGLS